MGFILLNGHFDQGGFADNHCKNKIQCISILTEMYF